MSIKNITGETIGIDPLDKQHIYLEVNVPEEAASYGGVVYLTIAGQEYTISI